MNKRIVWIDWLKGICSILICTHHFCLRYLSATYYGNEAISYSKFGIDILFASSPLGVLLNGNFFICILLTITGFLYFIKINSSKQEKKIRIFSLFLKRFLYLLSIVSIFGIIIFTLTHIMKYLNINYYKLFNYLNLKEFLATVFFYQWTTKYNTSIIGTFWPLRIFLIGSYLSIVFSLFDSKEKKYIPYLYIAIAIICNFVEKYYSPVFLGLFLGDLYFYRLSKIKKLLSISYIKPILTFIFLLIGIFMGGYPSYAQPSFKPYLVLKCIFGSDYILIHSIASYFIILSCIINSESKVINNKHIASLGNMLIETVTIQQILLYTLAPPLFKALSFNNNYLLTIAIIYFITMVITILMSFLYYSFITTNIRKGIKRLCKKIML